MPLAIVGITCSFFTVVGTPSYLAFFGNQWVLPEQQKQMVLFYSIQYFIVNVGSTLGQVVGPIFRQEYRCFGEPECYAMAMGIGFIFSVAAYGLYELCIALSKNSYFLIFDI